MIERINEIYDNAEFLVRRIASDDVLRQQWVNAQCMLRIANGILEENNLSGEMGKRVDILATIAESHLQEVRQ